MEINSDSAWIQPDKQPDKPSSENVVSTNKEDVESEECSPPVVPRRTVVPATLPTNQNASIISPPPPPHVDRAIPIAVAFIETVNGVFRGSDEKRWVNLFMISDGFDN